MRTDTQRIAKYIAKTDPATVRRKVAAQLPTMIAAYAVSADEEVALETRVHNFLDQEQVVLDRFCYLNFAKRLYWKGIKKCSGARLGSYAQREKDKWLARGLDDGVMKRLALDVFGITLA
jgi:hypothetical protein